MTIDQRIIELQRKIDALESEKQGITLQVNKIKNVFLGFKTQYDSVMTEMDTRLSVMTQSIQTLRNELAVLKAAKDTAYAPQTEEKKAASATANLEFNKQDNNNAPVATEVKKEPVVEEPKVVETPKIVAAEVKQETEKSEIVKENVVAQETEAKPNTIETATSEVAEKVDNGNAVATGSSDSSQTAENKQYVTYAQQSAQTQQTAQTAKTTQSQQTQQKTNTASQKAASAQPKEDSIFDKIRDNFDWEKFFGENLIMKLGILIMLIGIAIGGKYAIDNQLLSPTMRIIIGVIFGAALQGVAIKLKKEYTKLSAVLASGAMATLYFMTFFAYSLYDLIPMPVAFVLMALITVATVWQACTYDMEIIAIIGLVAAYVIPFALSTGEGSPWALFSYISIINAGVMFISVKRYWRILFVSAYVSSWLIFTIVYRTLDFTAGSDSMMMLLFFFINFIIFYITFLAYKVRHSLIFQHFDILFLLSNSFLFFGLGYNDMFNSETLAPYVALFTFFNAVLHAVVSFVLIKRNMVDKSVYRLIMGLAISFLTIAIMVWLTGHWLTMFWMLEGAVLFTVSRISQRPFYEKMSYPVLFLALISLIIDWGNPNGGHLMILTPLFDAFAHYRSMWDVSNAAVQGSALSIINTVVFIALCIFIGVIDSRYPMVENEETQNSWMKFASKCMRVMAVFVVTSAFLVHIEHPWLTMCWMAEAVILFTFSRIRKILFFEKASYPVFFLAFFSLLIDWGNPSGDHLSAFEVWYDVFASKNTFEGYGVGLSIVNSIVFVVLSVFASFINLKYPLVENEETKDSLLKTVSSWVMGMTVVALTMAILVHVDRPWLTLCWMIEATVLFCFSRIRQLLCFEKSSYPVFILSIISLIIDWGNPNGGHLNALTSLFEIFSERPGCPIHGFTQSVVVTVAFVALSILSAVIDRRYPMVETEENKNSWVRVASRCLTLLAMFVVSMAILVFIDQPWLTMCWAIEAIVLCYLGRAKTDSMVEFGSYVMLMFTTFAFFDAWSNLPEQYDFVCRIEKFQNNFGMSIAEMWTSVVAGLSLIASIVVNLWIINKFNPAKEGVAEKLDMKFVLKLWMISALTFIIWTHTPWVVTTILLFGLALLSLIFALRDDARLKVAFVAVFGVGFFCWLFDVFTAYEDRKMLVMAVSSMICVTIVLFMRHFNENEKFAINKMTLFPFVALLVLMPFVTFGYIVVEKVEDWATLVGNDVNIYVQKWTMSYALAYFSIWTFVSLKRNLRGFKTFTMTCLTLVLFVKLVLSAFELKIVTTPTGFDLLHIVTLILMLFSGWTLYLYKKQEKCMFGMDESLTTKAFDTFLYFGSVVLIGKELNKICQVAGSPESFGVVFSVFLGIVSLFGIYYGLYKDKKYLRIEGIVLLGFTLLKLFFYDMKHFDTIYKVIALVSLGVLMLVMSFFYQKIAKEKERERLSSQPREETSTSEPENANVEQPKNETPLEETNYEEHSN